MMWWMIACSGSEAVVEPEPGPDPAVVLESARTEAEAEANRAADALLSALKGRLTEAMGRDGPTGALTACADEAQGIAALAAGRGARAGRTSTKLRNRANRAPDWVEPWLAKYGSGTVDAAESVVDIEEIDGQIRARIIRPIVVAPPCLTCHGSPESIPPDVASLLATRYPDDAATGYGPGDLRGAVWAEASAAGAK